jgi:hypothetical protein
LKIWFADLRGRLREELDGGRTSKDDRDDRIPDKKSRRVLETSQALALRETYLAEMLKRLPKVLLLAVVL